MTCESSKIRTVNAQGIEEYIDLDAILNVLCFVLEISGPIDFERKVSDSCTLKVHLEKVKS